MHSFEYKQGKLFCEDVDLATIAKEFGTPTYVYSASTILDHYRRLDKAFESIPHLICYAVKANSNLAVLNLLARLGSGFDLVSGGTDNHLILIDLTSKGVAGKPAAQALDRAGLEANYNTVPFDPRKPFDPSGLRIGTPSVTSRGMREAEMRQIAAWMDEVVTALAKGDAEETIARVHREVSALTAQFPTPGLDG